VLRLPQEAKKGSSLGEEHPSTAKAGLILLQFTARETRALTQYLHSSAACKGRIHFAALTAWLKPCPFKTPDISSRLVCRFGETSTPFMQSHYL
jgi:hypothetical protein